MRRRWTILFLTAGLAFAGAVSLPAVGQTPAETRAGWQSPGYAEIRRAMIAWRDAQSLAPDQLEDFARRWPEQERAMTEEEALELAAETFARCIPEAKALYEFCGRDDARPTLPVFVYPPPMGGSAPGSSVAPEGAAPTGSAGSGGDPFTRRLPETTMRLYVGRWLVRHGFHDEAIEQMDTLSPDEVIAPSTLLFFQSVALHRLLRKDACLPRIAMLLQNESSLPRRYRDLAKLMAADLKPLEDGSLDEISRLMEDVRRRLWLARAGKRVRDEEDEVVNKLDKMIEEIEKQQQQQQQAGGGGGTAPNQPLPDSVPAGGKGPGNVAQRDLGSGSGWGNLPPRERDEALQEITKNLPSHYREVIEEYFRRLARASD
ncbi:MAG: hypothetical protein FJ297_04905 [Planctomycetes bacterium]|nr:hypothetical protein [Planctomycetota bacterium]